MLVSQYIFTACGKQKNGDFTVWSKTADITDAEGEEIHQLMTYKNPSGVNLYEASEEEIKKACPTKYAYFVLSTGKKVLAESNFIGRVYSGKTEYGQDTRWGNFFIHAYVFDSLGEMFPMSFLNKNKFKSKLEFVEWHDNPCPETLPQIDIQPDALNFREVEAFLTAERKQSFPILLQAVINAANTDSSVVLIDTDANLELWYTAIGLFLPPQLREKVTFGSKIAAVNNFNASSGLSGAKPLTIRNVAVSSFSTSQPIFDLTKNIIASISLDAYIAGIRDALGKSLLEALEYVNEIDNLCNAYDCNREQAVPLFMLKNNRVQWFSNFDEFIETNNIAEKYNILTPNDAVSNIYSSYFVQKKWNDVTISAALLKRMYRYGDTAIRKNLIDYYISHIENYASSSADALEYVESFFSAAPFSASEFLQYLVAQNSFAAGFASQNDFRWNNLIYVTLLKELSHSGSDKIYSVMLYIFVFYSNEKTVKEVNTLLSEAYSVSGKLAEKLILDTICRFDNAENNNRMMFFFIEAVKSQSLQLEILKRVVEMNEQSSHFISEYTKYYNNNPSLYSALENELIREQRFSNFKIIRETYAFSVNNNIVRSDLNNYFNNYYLKGFDRGLYLEKLKYYLAHSPNEKSCFEIYSDICRTGVDINRGDMKDVLLYIHKKMYEPSAEYILQYSAQETSLRKDLDSKLYNNRIELDPKRNYVDLIQNLKTAEGSKEATVWFVEKLIQYNSFVTPILNERQIDELVANYLCVIVNIYLNYRTVQNSNEKNDDYICNNNMRVLTLLFSELIKSRYFKSEFMNVMAKSNTKNSMILLSDMFVFACNYHYSFADDLRGLLNYYIGSFSNRKKAERLIGDILSSVPEQFKQNIQIFTEQLGFVNKKEEKKKNNDKKEKDKKEGGGFFSQIFGFGKKDKTNKDDD